ncbi:dispanin subfamily A member 2b-like [Anolis sagrei]|uniref:dispanin subfamily A member 2b-like n=1 Tax=Anolis sagrei TaxID=38937 RepID=UPI003520D2D3
MNKSKYYELEDNESPTYEEIEPLKHHAGLQDPMGYGATTPIPPGYRPNYDTPGARSNQTPELPSPLQGDEEPDHLCYSIFTMLCCCFPLGAVALVFSIQTRQANLRGDNEAAGQHSRTARILADLALGTGAVYIIVYVGIIVLYANLKRIGQ